MTPRSKQIRQKMQNTEKNSCFKRIDRKCRLTEIRNEQNNDYTQKIHRIQFVAPLKRPRL